MSAAIPSIIDAANLAALLARQEGEGLFGFAFDHDNLRYWIAGLRYGPTIDHNGKPWPATYFVELFLCVRPLEAFGKRWGDWWRIKGGQDDLWYGILPVIADETFATLHRISMLNYPAQRFDGQDRRLDAA